MPKRTLEELTTIIVDNLGIDTKKVLPESTARDLGADSLDEIEILMGIEETFHVEITDAEAEAASTVGDYVKLIDLKLDEKDADRELHS